MAAGRKRDQLSGFSRKTCRILDSTPSLNDNHGHLHRLSGVRPLRRPMFFQLDSYRLKKNHEPIAYARSIRGFFTRPRITLGKPAVQNAYQLSAKSARGVSALQGRRKRGRDDVLALTRTTREDAKTTCPRFVGPDRVGGLLLLWPPWLESFLWRLSAWHNSIRIGFVQGIDDGQVRSPMNRSPTAGMRFPAAR